MAKETTISIDGKVIDVFKDDISGFKAIANEYDLHPVSFYFHLTRDEKEDIRQLETKIDFVAENGIKTLCVQGSGKVEETAEADLYTTLNTINKYAKICEC